MRPDRFEPKGFEGRSAPDASEALDELKYLAEIGGIREGQLPRIRKLVKAIGSEMVILREMGPEWVRRYFSALQGSGLGHPYFLPNSVHDDHLGAYLDFEFGDDEYRRQCIADFITQPLDGDLWNNIRDLNLATNLALSHLRQDIEFFVRIDEWVTGPQMIAFLKRVDNGIANPQVRQSFGHLFDEKRWRLVARYTAELKKGKRMMAKKTLTKIRKQDRLFFDRLQTRALFGV
ncbi:hypothetical protein JW752_02710 [Candidatus Peregrinibacteria bacterium]|nr:hypothetical protein [Candidatus Peregrinibacteria bacterium]